jgi:flagellar biosynthesis/type III secretory pathway protein FliH
LSASRIVLTRRPIGAALVEGGLDAWFAQRIAAERASAFAAGHAEGERLAVAGGAGRLDTAVERLEAERQVVQEKLSSVAAALGLQVARALARAEVRTDRHDVERLVREVLASGNVGRAPCQVHLHPEDAARLAGTTFRAGTEIVPDVGVSKGDVQIATPQGLLVHELDDALSRLARRLEEELE